MRIGRCSRQKIPKAIDLFSGCGGLTLGLRRAGFRVVGAVERDILSVKTYQANHKGVRVWECDIRQIEPWRIRRDLGLKKGELDLLAGCPPCQSFSAIQTRVVGRTVRDDRNALVFSFADFIAEFRPTAVMMENVPGLVSYYRFREFVERLESLGYLVDHQIVDAADHGVPQRRKRLVLAASRVGAVCFPGPSRRKRTVREAIGGLPNPGSSGDPLHDVGDDRSKRIARLIALVPKNGGSRMDLGIRRQLECHRRTPGFFDVYGRMRWDDVAPTITSGFVNPSKGRFLHPTQDRTITPREAALLQSFPRSYFISMDRGKYPAAELIGNAFPPELARRHARALWRAISQTRQTARKSQCRGSTKS